MENIKQKTVAQVVTENIETAHVFKKYGIDFCSKGFITVEKACENRSIDINKLIKELLNSDAPPKNLPNFDKMSLDKLINYILNHHHQYDRDALPLMMNYSTRVATLHIDECPELKEIQNLTEVLYTEMMSHMGKEESVLFPMIKDMVQCEKDGSKMEDYHFGSVENPISAMEHEHDSATEIFRELRRLSNNFQPPAGASNSFRAFYNLLEDFEADLHQHIHLENNILFPKAAKLESKLNQLL